MVMRWMGCFPLMLAMGLGSSVAVEFPAGVPQEYQGMRIAGNFLQALAREPDEEYGNSHLADIHLGAAIHATRDNPDGLREGDWIPFLHILYSLKRAQSTWSASGELLPMAAPDGPHYGANVRLDGPGIYALTLLIAPTERDHLAVSPRIQGLRSWEPFLYEGTLTYADSRWSDVIRGAA